MYNQYRTPINEDEYQHKEDKDQSPERVDNTHCHGDGQST